MLGAPESDPKFFFPNVVANIGLPSLTLIIMGPPVYTSTAQLKLAICHEKKWEQNLGYVALLF